MPKLVEALREVRVVSVVAGFSYSAAVSHTGALNTWGAGSNGLLGHGEEKYHLTPKLVEALREVKVVSTAAGERHSAAVSHTGALYTWGSDEDGQLGHSDRGNQLTPKLVEALREVNVVSVAVGGYAVAVSELGQFYSWGFGDDACLGHGDLDQRSTPTLVQALCAAPTTE